MRAAKVQASLCIGAVSPEPSLLAHTSSESRGTFRQKARSLALLNGWACAVKICHDGMLEDTNSLEGAHILVVCCIWCKLWITASNAEQLSLWWNFQSITHNCLRYLYFAVLCNQPVIHTQIYDEIRFTLSLKCFLGICCDTPYRNLKYLLK